MSRHHLAAIHLSEESALDTYLQDDGHVASPTQANEPSCLTAFDSSLVHMSVGTSVLKERAVGGYIGGMLGSYYAWDGSMGLVLDA
jgi:hypothetical protein